MKKAGEVSNGEKEGCLRWEAGEEEGEGVEEGAGELRADLLSESFFNLSEWKWKKD